MEPHAVRKYAKIAVAVIGTAVVCVGLKRATQPKEPIVQGRSLSSWLEDYYHATHPGAGAFAPTQEELLAEKRRADAAIRELGTNALPWLIEWVTYQPSAAQKKLQRFVSGLPRQASPLNRLVYNQRKLELTVMAPGGFQILCDQTAPVVQQLGRLLSNPDNNEAYHNIARGIAHCGTNGIPTLLRALSETNRWGNKYILSAFYEMDYLGTNASPVIPALVTFASDSNMFVATTAIQALGHLNISEDQAIPALTNALAASDVSVRFWAVRSLAKITHADVNLVEPALRGMLQDPNADVRTEATNGLATIIARASTTNAAPP